MRAKQSKPDGECVGKVTDGKPIEAYEWIKIDNNNFWRYYGWDESARRPDRVYIYTLKLDKDDAND
jgi:hypothetical protein